MYYEIFKNNVGKLKRGMAAIQIWQPNLHAAGFIILAAFGNAILYQKPLYAFAVSNVDYFSLNGVLTLITLFFLAVFVTTLFLSIISVVSHRLLKPVCMLGALCNALALYFVDTYAVVLDRAMMGNVFNTNIVEASSFFHFKLVVYLLILGVLPCWLVSRIQVDRAPLLRRIIFMIIVVLIGTAWFYANSKTWLWMDKHASRLGGMIMPWSYVVNMSRHYANNLASSKKQTLLPAAQFATNEKTIVFLVIGESARAQNFSLYGYSRPTNPLMAEAGVVALPRSRACATYTTASLLCILSHSDAARQFSRSYEPLPNYLQRHGIDVVWRSNNWGEPKLEVETYQHAKDLRRECQGEACGYDDVLLHRLDERIRSSRHEKIFVVLHQGGSHGPSYYKKYPKQFEVFKPVCKSVELNQCTNEELVNAYDNTILYTDHFLHRAIGLLATFPKAATMMMYISDHGESLGEYGLYLHGTPYSVAPDVQKDIPFVIWMSDAFMRTRGLSARLLIQQQSYSHDYVFHSVMGAFDMRSEIHNRQLDLFSARNR